MTEPEPSTAPIPTPTQKQSGWDQIKNVVATGCAIMTAIGLFKIFGPISDLNVWFHNVLKAYAKVVDLVVVAPLDWFGVTLTEREANHNLIGLTLIGINARALTKTESLIAISKRFLLILPPLLFLGFIYLVGFANGVRFTIGNLEGTDAFPLPFWENMQTFGFKFLLVLPAVFAISLTSAVLIDVFFPISPDSKSIEREVNHDLLRHLFEQTGVVVISLIFIFILGTTIFFDFG